VFPLSLTSSERNWRLLKKESIDRIAAQCGMDIWGCAPAGALLNTAAFFDEEKSLHSAFSSKDARERLNAQAALSGAKSVFSFGVAYRQELHPIDDGQLRGKIARVSLGRDYHQVLKGIASEFVRRFKEESEESFDAACFVDDGPISDKMAAYACGLGFVGRNSLIVNPRFGSFVFLGTILVTAAMPYGEGPVLSGCKGCNACVSACPAGALGPGGFAFEACISYQTQKGPLGAAAASAHALYGCDACQEACPYNERAEGRCHEAFAARGEEAFPLISDILSLSEDEYKRRYSNSALFWRGLKRLRQNAKSILEFEEARQAGRSDSQGRD